MNSIIYDTAQFFKNIGNRLKGMCTSYVKDFMYPGDKENSKITEETERKFQWERNLQWKPREWYNIQFVGVHIESKIKSLSFIKKVYISMVNMIPRTANYTTFGSGIAKIASNTQTRPDTSC